MIGNSRALPAAAALLVAVTLLPRAERVFAEDNALTLRASVVGGPVNVPVTIELFRWSTDAERAPMLTALAAPPPAPPTTAPPAGTAPTAPAAGGRAAGRGNAGRGGRGGGGGRGAAPPASPAVRLSAAVKAAPTLGFIWADGPTGYSIKYAWRSSSPDGQERVVLVTDRRLGAHAPSWPSPPASAKPDDEAEFTVLEMRIDGKGTGEGKSSLATGVVVDGTAKTLALDGYAAAPTLLKVTR